MRLAVGEGLTQEAIEAARQTMGTHVVPLVGKGSGSATTSMAHGVHLGSVVSCPNVTLLLDTEERQKEAQMKHFNCLKPPGFKGTATAVEAKERLQKIHNMLDTIGILRSRTGTD